jgi:hypothetical protein
MDGYDDCIIGVVEQYGRPPIVCYDKPKVLAKLKADDMIDDEAAEFWAFNQIGAYWGENTPCFLTPKKVIESEESSKKPKTLMEIFQEEADSDKGEINERRTGV